MTEKKSRWHKYMSLLCVFLFAFCAAGAEVYWVGGASGRWCDGENWSIGDVPPHNSTIMFDTGSDVLVEYGGSVSNQLAGYKVLSGNVVVTSYGKNPTMYIASRSFSVDVAEGSTCIISNSMYTYYSSTRFTKKGGGSFTVSGGAFDNGQSIKELIVEAGEFRHANAGANNVNYGPATNRVCSGARLVLEGKITTGRYAPLELPQGASFKLVNGASISCLHVVGEGDISGEGSASSLWIGNSDCNDPFTGTFSGNLRIVFSDAAAQAGNRFIVQRSDQLSNILGVRSPGGLGFKARVGTFYIPVLDGFYGKKRPVCLEDEEGKPITVYAALENSAGVEFSGSGNFIITNNVKVHPADNFKATGFFGVEEEGYYLFSSGFDLTGDGATISGLKLEGGSFDFQNGTDIEVPLTGIGSDLYFYGARKVHNANVTVENLYLRSSGATHEFIGGDIVVCGNFYNVGGVTNVIRGAVLSNTNVVDTADGDTTIKRRGMVSFNANEGAASIAVEGGELYFNGGWGTKDILLKGGKTHVNSNFGCYPNGDNGSTILFDGGEIVFEMGSASSFEFQPDSKNYHRRIGAKGGRISIGRHTGNRRIAYYLYHDFATQPGVDKDGGLELYGNGKWLFYQALDMNGPLSVSGGIICPVLKQFTNTNTSVIYGSGDFKLRDAILDVTTGSIPDGRKVELSLASGQGSKFIYDGASCIRFRHSANKAHPSLTAGMLQRAGKGSVLLLHELDNSTHLIGAADGDRFTVAGKSSTPLVTDCVVIIDSTLSRNHFAKYDENLGFTQLSESDYQNDYSDSGKVAYITNTITLSESATVPGIRYSGWKSKTEIKENVTLSVGNGTDPAMVVFATAGSFTGSGKLDFGTSEGIFYGGYSNDSNKHKIHCKVSGSGGVSYVAYPDYNGVDRMVEVTGANDYTGGTFIRACMVLPSNAKSFADGDVYVGSGQRIGGTVRFNTPLELANNFHLAGYGYSALGTLRFLADAAITGNVEIEEETRISAMNGIIGTISGEVSGDRLVVWGNADGGSLSGEISLLGQNVHTGGTEVVRTALSIVSGDALGTGEVLLDNGTLVCRNTSALTIGNTISGVGTIRLAGSGKVEFSKLASQDNNGFELNLDCKFPKISSLKGISSITSSRRGKVYLLVTDDEVNSWNGTVTGNVSIQYGDEVKTDGFRILVK